MSEKERVLLEKIARLPKDVQDRFVDKIDGAATAVEVLKTAQPAQSEQG